MKKKIIFFSFSYKWSSSSCSEAISLKINGLFILLSISHVVGCVYAPQIFPWNDVPLLYFIRNGLQYLLCYPEGLKQFN